jgi:type II restriction enzyme
VLKCKYIYSRTMHLRFNKSAAQNYHSHSQIARILTEDWTLHESFCPNCGGNLSQYENSRPVADFFCPRCNEDYELKSNKHSMGGKIVDGAYSTMIERLQSSQNPNFFFLNYELASLEVLNFLVIPKHFFVADIIEKRRPLAQSARRAGWVGCNILTQSIPQTGKIFFVRNRIVEPKNRVRAAWQKTLFLREERETSEKGWILDIMNCVDKLGKKEFSIDEIYAFEGLLRQKHPNNRHIKDKIRQQLQYLRDKGYLAFVTRGKYRVS